MQDITDKPHIVMRGQPAKDDRVLVATKSILYQLLVMQQALCGDDYSLGFTRRAGGVLNKGDAVGGIVHLDGNRRP